MMNYRAKKHLRPAAFSYTEVLVSSIIVSVLLVAALKLSGNLAFSNQATLGLDTANRLALLMIQEIKSQAYGDPQSPVGYGIESDESSFSRADFDDIDDYHNYAEGPPQDAQGNALSQYTDYTREVQVCFVAPNDFSQTVHDDQGFKAVTVTVRRGTEIITQRLYVFANVNWNPR